MSMKSTLYIFLIFLLSSCSNGRDAITHRQAWLSEEETRSHLMNSQSLTFSYSMKLSDGGSKYFSFINNRNEEVLIYFPYPFSFSDNDFSKKQEVYIVPPNAPDFISESYILIPNSEEERHLVKLISKLPGSKEWSPDNLVYVIEERQYSWFAQPKFKKPRVRVDKSPIQNDLIKTIQSTNILNQQGEPIANTPVESGNE